MANAEIRTRMAKIVEDLAFGIIDDDQYYTALRNLITEIRGGK